MSRRMTDLSLIIREYSAVLTEAPMGTPSVNEARYALPPAFSRRPSLESASERVTRSMVRFCSESASIFSKVMRCASEKKSSRPRVSSAIFNALLSSKIDPSSARSASRLCGTDRSVTVALGMRRTHLRKNCSSFRGKIIPESTRRNASHTMAHTEAACELGEQSWPLDGKSSLRFRLGSRLTLRRRSLSLGFAFGLRFGFGLGFHFSFGLGLSLRLSVDLAFHSNFKRRGDLRMQLYRDVELTHALDGLIKLDLATVNPVSLGGEPFGDIEGRHGTEERAFFTSFPFE